MIALAEHASSTNWPDAFAMSMLFVAIAAVLIAIIRRPRR